MNELCVNELCVNELCVNELCVNGLCVNELCVNELCVDELCVNELCVKLRHADTLRRMSRSPNNAGIYGMEQVWVQLRAKPKNNYRQLKSFCVGDVHYCNCDFSALKLQSNVFTQALLFAPHSASRKKVEHFLKRMYVWVKVLDKDGNIGPSAITKLVPLSALTRTTLTGKELANAKSGALHQCEQFWASCVSEDTALAKVESSRVLSSTDTDTDTDSQPHNRRPTPRKGSPSWMAGHKQRVEKRTRISPQEAAQRERATKFRDNFAIVEVKGAKKLKAAANTKASLVKMAMAVTRTVAPRKAAPTKAAATRKAAVTKIAAGKAAAGKVAAGKVAAGKTAASVKKALQPNKTVQRTVQRNLQTTVRGRKAAAARVVAARVTAAKTTAARRASTRSTQLAPQNDPQLLAQIADLAEKVKDTEKYLKGNNECLTALKNTLSHRSSASSFLSAKQKQKDTEELLEAVQNTMLQCSTAPSDDQAKALMMAQLAAMQQQSPRRSPRLSPTRSFQPGGHQWSNLDVLMLAQDRNAQGERQTSMYQLERDRLSLERDRITAKREREDQARASAPASAPASNSASALLSSASRLYAACACTLPLDAGRSIKTRTRSGAGAGGPEDARADTTGGAHSLFKVLQPRQTNLFRWAQR